MKPLTYNAFWETSWIAMQKMFQHYQLFTPATTMAVNAVEENTDASTFDIPEERRGEFFQCKIDLYESVLTPKALKEHLLGDQREQGFQFGHLRSYLGQ